MIAPHTDAVDTPGRGDAPAGSVVQVMGCAGGGLWVVRLVG